MFLIVITRSVYYFLSALSWLMLFRAIFDILSDGSSKLHLFCCVVTEPVIMPVRAILSHIPALDGFPIDLSYMATYLLIIIVQMALPVS